MKKIILIIVLMILFPITVFAIETGYICEEDMNGDYRIVYGNIKNCSIQLLGEELGVLVDFCGKKACAQKIPKAIQVPIYNVTCESGFSLVEKNISQYGQYESITFCMSKVNVANTNLNYENVCGNDSIMSMIRIIGYIINIIKWVIPFVIIILGMADFGKAITSEDEKAATKSLSALARRLIAGVIIFFVPTIVLAVINLFDISKGIEKENHASFGACTRCLLDPYRSECKISK